MDSFAGRQHRHRGRKDRAGEVAQPRRDRRMKGSGRTDGSTRTAARTMVALGIYVARDLHDRDGVARPLLRRSAVRMIASRRNVVRRLGTTYLHNDPPTPDELRAAATRAAVVTPPFEPRRLPPAMPDRVSETTANAPDAKETRPKDDKSHPEDDDTV
jgi:hypothetical protein